MGTIPKPLPDKFWAKVQKGPGCWEWQASRFVRTGYGQFRERNAAGQWTSLYAHRVAYELCIGPIPEGLQVDHACHNRACVNPAHLRLATNKQNQENRATQKSASGYRGVRQNTYNPNKWDVQVTHHGRSYFGGSYWSPEEANQAAIALRNKLFTHNILDRTTRKETTQP